MAKWDLSQYEPVEDRLARFWADNPRGRVSTHIIDRDPSSYIVCAEVFKEKQDPVPDATGLAHENVTQSGVNSTSALENCETSAIGRALANLGYAPKGARPSREEMQKAERAPKPKTPSQWRAAIGRAAKERDIPIDEITARFAEDNGGEAIGSTEDVAALEAMWILLTSAGSAEGEATGPAENHGEET